MVIIGAGILIMGSCIPIIGPGILIMGSCIPIIGPGIPIMGSCIPIIGTGMPIIGPGIFIIGLGMPIIGPGIPIMGTGIIILGSVIPIMGPPITIIGVGIIFGLGTLIIGFGISISIKGDIPIPIIGDIPIPKDNNISWLPIDGLFIARGGGAKGAALIKDIVVPAAGTSAFIPFIAMNGSFIKPTVAGDITALRMGDIDIPTAGTAPRPEATGSSRILIEGSMRPGSMP